MAHKVETCDTSYHGEPADFSLYVPDERLILAIETSNPAATDPSDAARGHDGDLIPATDRLFAAHLIDRSQLRGGVVAERIGPGGYAGVRVVCATGAMLTEAAAARAIAKPTALVGAHGLGPRVSALGRCLVSLVAKGKPTIESVLGHGGKEDGRIGRAGRTAPTGPRWPVGTAARPWRFSCSSVIAVTPSTPRCSSR